MPQTAAADSAPWSRIAGQLEEGRHETHVRCVDARHARAGRRMPRQLRRQPATTGRPVSRAASRAGRAGGGPAFEALVRAYGRQDWDGVMDVFADDAQIESAAPEAAGPAGNTPRILNKREFGQALVPIIASNVGYSAQNVQLRTVSPMQVQVSGTMTLLMAGRPSIHRDRLWVFEKRGERWLVVRAQDP